MDFYQTKFTEKLKEAFNAVLPIIGIVLFLSFTIAPVPSSILLLFLFGAVLLIIGMMFFTLGAELSMTPMGEKRGPNGVCRKPWFRAFSMLPSGLRHYHLGT